MGKGEEGAGDMSISDALKHKVLDCKEHPYGDPEHATTRITIADLLELHYAYECIEIIKSVSRKEQET